MLFYAELTDAKNEGREEGRAEGRTEGLIMSAKIFKAIQENRTLSNNDIAAKLSCSVQEIEDVRRVFGI